ncbi:MAG: hypothetical protein HYT31_04950 [Parcubacteria group bacterium]|nr:hypothetical protein [Parcubacteria group bacterium]
MYAYFIDDWASNSHHRLLDRLDLLSTQQGISGRKVRLSRLSNITSDIRECLGSGIKTFVAVGDDATASRILNHALILQSKEPFSFEFCAVPLAGSNEIARLFGINSIPEAVDALAGHRTHAFDLGVLNQRHYFVTAAVFPKQSALRFKSYSVSSLHQDHHISVCNADIYRSAAGPKKITPDDGVLEAVIAYRPRYSFWDRIRGREPNTKYVPESFFPIKKITIRGTSKTVSIFADTEKQLTSPIEVEVKARGLTAIVHS